MSCCGRMARQAASAARTIASGRVDATTSVKRQATCSLCPERSTRGFTSFCDACDCPRIEAFNLAWRNRRTGWRCPLRKF